MRSSANEASTSTKNIQSEIELLNKEIEATRKHLDSISLY